MLKWAWFFLLIILIPILKKSFLEVTLNHLLIKHSERHKTTTLKSMIKSIFLFLPLRPPGDEHGAHNRRSITGLPRQSRPRWLPVCASHLPVSQQTHRAPGGALCVRRAATKVGDTLGQGVPLEAAVAVRRRVQM